jgi:hypothetical protein
MNDCGGCQGLGAHRRWCPANVGFHASVLGRWSQEADDLADAVGSNEPAAANHLYVAAAVLRARAIGMAEAFRRATDTPV